MEKQRKDLFKCREELSATQKDFIALQDDIRRCYEAKNKIYQQGWENRDMKTFESLLTEEVQLARQEGQIRKDLILLEEREKASLDALSSAIWMSHEKAMAANTHSKQLSAIASLIGGVFGFASSMLVYRRQMKRLERKVHLLPEKMADVMASSDREITACLSSLSTRLVSLEGKMPDSSSCHLVQESSDAKPAKDGTSLIPVLLSMSVTLVVAFCLNSLFK